MDDFGTNIQTLASIFDNNRGPLRRHVENPNPDWGNISLLDEWLRQNGAKDYRSSIDTWRNINTLRQSMAHTYSSPEIIKAYKYFDEKYPVEDYSRLWNKILDHFLKSLINFVSLLQNIK